jgi:hypothetical protein
MGGGELLSVKKRRSTAEHDDLEEPILGQQDDGWNEHFGTWNGKLATRRESRILVLTSCSGFISVLIAVFVFREYWLGGLACIVTVNSINFWRDPVLGCRRNVDFACANTGALLMGCSSFYCHFQLVWACLMVGIALPLFVVAGKMWIGRDKRWVWCHLCFHVLCGFTNYLMYDGRRIWSSQHPTEAVHPPLGFDRWRW